MRTLLLIISVLLSGSEQSDKIGHLKELPLIEKPPSKTSKEVIEKGISVTLNTNMEYLSQTSTQKVTLAVKVQANDGPIILENRLPVDLVITADTSHSMVGESLVLMKEAILFVIKNMEACDRLALFSFENYTTNLLDFTPMDAEGKKKAEQLVKKLIASGGTNIHRAMKITFDHIKKRKFQNPVTSVLLISDGLDLYQKSVEPFRKLAMDFEDYMRSAGDSYRINSFGISKSHDEKALSVFAKVSGGSFYYLQKADQLKTAFADSVGQLLSVVGRKAYIAVILDERVSFLEKYGDSWIPPTVQLVEKITGKSFKSGNLEKVGIIRVELLSAGMSRTYVADLGITLSEAQILNTAAFAFATSTFSFVSSFGSVATNCALGKFVRPTNGEINGEVEEEGARVRGGKILNKARAKALAGDFDGAESELNSFNLATRMNGALSDSFKNRMDLIFDPKKISDPKTAEEASMVLNNQQFSLNVPSFAGVNNFVQKKMNAEIVGSTH